MKKIVYLILIIAPLVWFSLSSLHDTQTSAEIHITDTTFVLSIAPINVLSDVSSPVERIKADINQQFSTQKDKWLDAIPKIILFLFVFGLAYIAVFAIKDIFSISGMYSIFLFISILELIYFLGLGGDAWFCSPEKVGWLWTVINFVLFAGVLYLQYYTFGLLTKRLTGRGVFSSFPIGIISGSIGVGLWLWMPDNQTAVYIALAILSLGQLVQLIINISRYGFLRGFFVSILYILCFTALVIGLFYLLKILLIIFLVGCLILGFISSAGASSSSSSGSSNSSSSDSESSGGGWGLGARNCSHFHEGSMMCDFHVGGRHECGYYRTGKCQHGQR
ncbi:hypothetical protein [Alistipes indistinctus]|uniref:hypothetical protein n=1 Tax=Alistipes indistinctus TaxID=626932 RepID=UPI0036F292F7